MRVLISSCSSFWISREAIELARRFEAPWAFDIKLWEEEGFIGQKEQPSGFDMTDDEWRKHEEQYSLPDEIPRHDPHLLRVFDELGGKRLAGFDDNDEILEVVVPDDIEYSIHSYTGEWVEEKHRTWTDRGLEWDSWRYFTKGSRYEKAVESPSTASEGDLGTKPLGSIPKTPGSSGRPP